MRHPLLQDGKWWLFRRHPRQGTQWWNEDAGHWEPYTQPGLPAGNAPGDQMVSYADTKNDPQLRGPLE